MKELHFDLSQSATRASLSQQLLAAMQAENVGANVDAVAQAAGVPDRHHHNLAEIKETIDALEGVSDRVKNDMREIYQILTEAEAQVHETTVEHAHFHEVGRAAGVLGVLRTCLMVEALNPERITATKVQTGSGKIECDHGIMDIPAPATAAIISRGIPTCDECLEGELCTPTSAAVIYHFVEEYIW